MKFKCLFTILFTLFISQMYAQKLTLKKGTIEIDNKKIMSYKTKAFGIEFSILKLNSNEEVINFNAINDYSVIYFDEFNIKMKTNKYYNTAKEFVKDMYDNEIFNSEGKLNIDKINLFLSKYSIDNTDFILVPKS